MSSAGIELTFWMDNNGVMRIGYDGLPQNDWVRLSSESLKPLKKKLPNIVYRIY